MRVTVNPQGSELHEALTYDFDDLKADSTVVTMRWEKLAVPFTVKVDPEATLANIRNQLRNSAQYQWNGWDDAATWCADNKTNLEEALKWSDRSIQMEDRFENLMTKARILDGLQRADRFGGRALQGDGDRQRTAGVCLRAAVADRPKKKAEAIAVFRGVAKRFPEHWLGHLSKARVAVADADFDAALKEVVAAQASAPESQKAQLDGLKKRIEKKEDING